MLTPDEIKIFSLCAPYLDKWPVIFDIGAYKGSYTSMALSRFNVVKYFMFEPNEELFNNLKKEFAPDRVFNLLVSDGKNIKPFYRCIGQADELSSAYKREIFGEVDYLEESKPSTSVDIFCNENEIVLIDMLKIDAEGSELDILNGCKEMLKNKCIRFIQVEYGGTYKDAGITFSDVIKLAYSFGYYTYELIEDKLNKVRLSEFVEDYRFTNFLITRHDFR